MSKQNTVESSVTVTTPTSTIGRNEEPTEEVDDTEQNSTELAIKIKPYRCTYPGCNGSYSHRSTLSRHKKEHEGQIHLCDMCTDGIMYTHIQLKGHKFRNHKVKEEFSCEKCDKSYKTEELLRNHMEIKHPKRKQQKNQSLPCTSSNSGYPAYTTSQDLNDTPSTSIEIFRFGNFEEKKRTTRKIVLETNATAVIVKLMSDPANHNIKYLDVITAKFSTFPQVPPCETINFRAVECGVNPRSIVENESKAEEVFGPVKLVLGLMNNFSGHINGQIDSISKSIPIRDWNAPLFQSLMESNGMKLALESAGEFKSRKPNTSVKYNDCGQNSCGISHVSQGFGHIYYAYGIKDSILNLYLGINRKPSSVSPILARCHKQPANDHTGLGIFIKNNPDVEINIDILYHIGSEEEQDQVESATILAAVLNTGGCVSINGKAISTTKLLNSNVNIPQQTPAFRQAVRIASITLFDKRPNFVLTRQPPDALSIDPIFAMYPEAKRFVE